MRNALLSSILATALQTLAYPIQQRSCEAWQTWPGQILSFDPFLAQVRFTVPCQGCFPASSASYDDSLAFNAYLLPCSDTADSQCLKLILNDHEVASTADGDGVSTHTVFQILDAVENAHEVTLVATTNTTSRLPFESVESKYLAAHIELQEIDGHATATAFTIAFDASVGSSEAFLIDSHGGSVHMKDPQSYCTIMSYHGDDEDRTSEEEYLAQEIEAIHLLEQDVDRLQREISAKKNAASVRLAQYHAHIPLEELMQRCDGIVCSAKAIANRLYEKLTLALDSSNGYNTLQTPMQSSASDETILEKTNSTSHKGNELPSLEHTSTNLLLQTLTCIASMLGLATLFTFIRRRCMSIRRRTERAADLEERHNARAYQRAARRAKLQRCWSAIQECFTFRRQSNTSCNTNYDEKRAMILQEALLEQHPEHMEKGDIMEAEIRQLRHAHCIIAGIVRGNHDNDIETMLIKDPPPALVPLPYSSSRSRSSTNTLPSYDSDSLPDYSSQPDDATFDVQVVDGFAMYSPPASVAGSDEYLRCDRTREDVQGPTSISSVAALSPRASNETLRTRATIRSRADSYEVPRIL